MNHIHQHYHNKHCLKYYLFWLAVALSLIPQLGHTERAINQLSMLDGSPELLKVPIYKSRIISLDTPVKKISVGNPEIADLLLMRANQLYILGTGLGTTNVLLWDKNNRLIRTMDIEVTHDLNGLKGKLHQLLPDEKIKVNSVQGAIVLSGEVSNLVGLDTALKVANSFSQQAKRVEKEETGEVINLLSVGGGQQVMVKVTVAEVNRDVLKRMGIKFQSIGSSGNFQIGGVSGGATFPDATFGSAGLRVPVFTESPIFGPAVDEFVPSNMAIEDKGLFASYLSSDFLFAMAIDAAKNNGTATILAEPTLTTLSGQEAEFLSGGEFPIPVPDEDGITVEFKEFGVGLRFLPVVMDTDRINLKINIVVSELVTSNTLVIAPGGTNLNFAVPALTKRSAHSTVELGNGQTIGIAGLMSEATRNSVEKFPGLGDLPILGPLFRSTEYLKNTTELVILVTPEIAQPVRLADLTLPTDGHLEPSDREFYLLGKVQHVPEDPEDQDQEQEQVQDQQSDVVSPLSSPDTKGGSESNFGHSIQ